MFLVVDTCKVRMFLCKVRMFHVVDMCKVRMFCVVDMCKVLLLLCLLGRVR